jgi:hypothetical protein
MKNKKTIFTAVFISTIIAVLLNLIAPDLYTLMYFNKIGETQLLTFGVLGFFAALILMLYLEARKKH